MSAYGEPLPVSAELSEAERQWLTEFSFALAGDYHRLKLTAPYRIWAAFMGAPVSTTVDPSLCIEVDLKDGRPV